MFHYFGRAVGRTIVNDENMKIIRQGKNLTDYLFNIFFFVVGRN